MSFNVDEVTGDITLNQGDSGEYTITGLETGYESRFYFSIYNSKREIIAETDAKTKGVNQDFVEFFIPTNFTDLLEVPLKDDYAEYYFGIKECYTRNDGAVIETTLNIGDKNIEDLNVMTVYPKKTEGDK